MVADRVVVGRGRALPGGLDGRLAGAPAGLIHGTVLDPARLAGQLVFPCATRAVLLPQGARGVADASEETVAEQAAQEASQAAAGAFGARPGLRAVVHPR